MNKAFLDEVRGQRAIKRLTQEDVATALGISRRSYVAFEQGQAENFKTKERLIKLCNLLDIEPPDEEESLIFKPKMTCEISSETQMYKGLMLAGLVEPGDKVTLVIERS